MRLILRRTTSAEVETNLVSKIARRLLYSRICVVFAVKQTSGYQDLNYNFPQAFQRRFEIKNLDVRERLIMIARNLKKCKVVFSYFLRQQMVD